MTVGNTTLVRNAFQSPVISTEDREIIVDLAGEGDYSYLYCYIELFSDPNGINLANPTSGVIEFKAAPLGNVFLPLENNLGVLNAMEINTGAYKPPVFDGHVDKLKIIFSGVANAPFARVKLWRND